MLKAGRTQLLKTRASALMLKAFVLLFVVGVCGVQTARAGLTIEPTTWNVIGLDSNDTSVGPATFPIGARICNTGGAAVTNVSSTFVWDSFNTYISLGGPSVINVPSLAAGACVDFYHDVSITRTSAAYNAARRYHITVTGDAVAAVSTPTPREVYVERLISQGRNSINSITGPSTVYVGQTYNYTVNASTATGGYQQLEAFLELPNVIFQVQSISTTYTAPSGATNNKFYADACGWDNVPTSSNYRSCIGPPNYSGGKAGGTVVTTYTVKILSTGTTTASTLVLDYSGSSYHYNNDYGTKTITITALPPPLTLSKIANPTTTTGGSPVTYTLRVTNTGPVNYTLTDFVDTPPTSPATPTYVSGSSYFNGASIPNPLTSGATRTWTGSYLVPAGQSRDLTYQLVMPNTTGTYVNTAIAHLNEFQIDTTPSTSDNAPATASVTVTAPDLTITKSHSGNFTQGQVGATYAITVTNSGSASTSSAVSVTDTLPVGLMATAMSGTGWSCILGTVTCTRSDALAAGASYPAITLTVDVANNAPATVTNSVSVSGGGQTNTGNDTAADPTTVTPFTAMSGALLGPLGQPGAVGITNTNDDYTNLSVTNGIAGVAPGGAITVASSIVFANTLQNTGNANDTFTITAPTVPADFTVEISTDNGGNYTIISGGGSVLLPVNSGSQKDILVRISVMSGATVLTGHETHLRATSGNDNTVFNETIDRLYTGYVHLNKSYAVSNGTGVGGASDAVSGAEAHYTISYTNISSSGGTNNSTLVAATFVTTDMIPANTDFKVGSVTSNPGTTGLTVTVTYSDDGGATWTYVPASGVGGAPAGYDRSVTHTRWSFSGNLSPVAPNNTGEIGFTVRIR